LCTGQGKIQFPNVKEVLEVPVPPKPAHLRRNRNRKAGGEWVILDKSYEGPIPGLPPIFRWSKETKRWWKAIWQSPMATQWLESDAEALSILALVRQRVLEGDTRVAVARELRLLESNFGLSPAGRQLRRWIVTEEDAERAGISFDDQVTELRKQRNSRLPPGG
jgi:hypothetical protein